MPIGPPIEVINEDGDLSGGLDGIQLKSPSPIELPKQRACWFGGDDRHTNVLHEKHSASWLLTFSIKLREMCSPRSGSKCGLLSFVCRCTVFLAKNVLHPSTC